MVCLLSFVQICYHARMLPLPLSSGQGCEKEQVDIASFILARATVQLGMAIIKAIVTLQRIRNRLKMKREIKK